jgi:ribokinase
VRVVVVGSLNMDLIVNVPHLPRPGETVIGYSLLRAPGGKGANQAVAAARLGANVTLIGRVGHDSFGRELTRGLRDEGVTTRWVLGSERATGGADRVDDRGENTIAVALGRQSRPAAQTCRARRRDCQRRGRAARSAGIEEAFSWRLKAVDRAEYRSSPDRATRADALDGCRDLQPRRAGDAARALGALGRGRGARALRTTPEQVVVVTLGARGALAVVGTEVIGSHRFTWK